MHKILQYSVNYGYFICFVSNLMSNQILTRKLISKLQRND
jgi:hypothetical protein